MLLPRAWLAFLHASCLLVKARRAFRGTAGVDMHACGAVSQAVTWADTTWGELKQGQAIASPQPVFARMEDPAAAAAEAAGAAAAPAAGAGGKKQKQPKQPKQKEAKAPAAEPAAAASAT